MVILCLPARMFYEITFIDIKISANYFRIDKNHVSKTYPIMPNLSQISCTFWITED